MNRAESVRRRAKRKEKAQVRLANAPARKQRVKRRDERADERRQETLRAQRRKWAACVFHGQSAKRGEIVCLDGYDTFLSLEVSGTGLRTLACTECQGEWWHVSTHP